MDIDTIDYNVQTVVTYGNSRCTCTHTKKERGGRERKWQAGRHTGSQTRKTD